MSNLVAHAKRELELAGMFDKDSDYDGMLGDGVLKLIEQFSKGGHSGGSAMMTLNLFDQLARFKNLTPLTNAPDEWNDVSDMSGIPHWQNKRNGEAFSEDGGKTYTLLSETMAKFECEKCGVAFTTGHPVTESDIEEDCDCGGKMVVTYAGKTDAEALHTAKEAQQQ